MTKLYELVAKVERAATKVEAVADDVHECRSRIARLERVVWIGLGILLAVQGVLSAGASFTKGQVVNYDAFTSHPQPARAAIRQFPLPPQPHANQP
jgi:hypothetical protein